MSYTELQLGKSCYIRRYDVLVVHRGQCVYGDCIASRSLTTLVGGRAVVRGLLTGLYNARGGVYGLVSAIADVCRMGDGEGMDHGGRAQGESIVSAIRRGVES